MNWTPDKQAHYTRSFNWSRTGMLLGLWTMIIFIIAGAFKWWCLLFPLTGALAILALGAAKELIYDKMLKKGTPEWGDMKANLLGALHGTIGRPNQFT